MSVVLLRLRIVAESELHCLRGSPVGRNATPEIPSSEASTFLSRSEFAPLRHSAATSTYDGDEDFYRALQAGARAYLLKGMTSEELIATIRTVQTGKSHIPPAIAEKLAERMGTEELTPREFDVLEQIVHGKSNKEIATALVISETTVKTHINRLLGKLSVTDRTQAATWAIQRGLVPLESLRNPQ